jgi:hypothetical protein
MIVLINLEGGEVIPVYSQINKLRTYVATRPSPSSIRVATGKDKQICPAALG